VWIEEEIELVVARRHWDPHQVLGAHAVNDGVVVRAFRPDAREVLARMEGGESVTLHQRHPAGLFEEFVSGVGLPLRYELEVNYPDGGVYTFRDPYGLAPTIGTSIYTLVARGTTRSCTSGWALMFARSMVRSVPPSRCGRRRPGQ
jgi:1,4-alpha-glucan branching enzyme